MHAIHKPNMWLKYLWKRRNNTSTIIVSTVYKYYTIEWKTSASPCIFSPGHLVRRWVFFHATLCRTP